MGNGNTGILSGVLITVGDLAKVVGFIIMCLLPLLLLLLLFYYHYHFYYFYCCYYFFIYFTKIRNYVLLSMKQYVVCRLRVPIHC